MGVATVYAAFVQLLSRFVYKMRSVKSCCAKYSANFIVILSLMLASVSDSKPDFGFDLGLDVQGNVR